MLFLKNGILIFISILNFPKDLRRREPRTKNQAEKYYYRIKQTTETTTLAPLGGDAEGRGGQMTNNQ